MNFLNAVRAIDDQFEFASLIKIASAVRVQL